MDSNSTPQNRIPPAPPLPATRNAFTRFVTLYGRQTAQTTSSVVSNTSQAESTGRDSYPKLPGYNPLTPQHAKYKTKVNAEVAALDINQDQTHAILAGREVLETISIHGTTCSEELNIREALYSHDRHNATRHRDNLDIHDVKWSRGAYSSTIACAATNGKIVLYDLHRPGIEVSRLHEHARQVHRLAFSPHQGALLLSASHDMTVKLWDLRDLRSEVASITSHAKYQGQSEGVRDVRWSPTDVLEFAFGTDSGTVQRWDHRNPKAAKLKINAHDAACKSIDWHPDGKHLLSAGLDRASGARSVGVLKVWDFSSNHRRQKPAWTLRTPYDVINARWRPPCWSGDGSGRGSWQATQVVTSYDEKYPIVHVWDFRRPFLPFREFLTSRTAPKDLLWRSIDLLWSVGREGDFYQTDIKYAPKTIDRRPLSTFAMSPIGEVVAFGQKRSRRRYSDMELSLPRPSGSSAKRVTPKTGTPELSRSSADDSIDDTFLSSSYQPRHHERTLSNRSSKSVGGTPPSLERDTLKNLDDTLDRKKENIQPQQLGVRGPIKGAGNINSFTYLAQKYKTHALLETPTTESYQHVSKAFEQNANYASKTGNHREAQIWRALGAELQHEVIMNAEQARQQRLSKSAYMSDPFLELPDIPLTSWVGNKPSRKSLPATADSPASHQQDNATVSESESNMPTPLAIPRGSAPAGDVSAQNDLPEPTHDDHLSLPPSVVSGGSSGIGKSLGGSGNRRPSRPNLEAPGWFSTNDINERKAMMSNWRAQPKAPLDLDTINPVSSPAINIPTSLDRHNSDESFNMFPSSSESKVPLSLGASLNSLRDRKQSMGSIPEHMQTSGFESFGQDSSGSTSFGPPVDDGSQSGSSKSDVFNGSFESLQLGESPLGTKGELLEKRARQGNGNLETSGTIVPDEDTQRINLPPIGKLQRSKTAAPAVQTVHYSESKKLVLEDYQKTPSISDRTYPIASGKMLQQAFSYHTTSVPDAQQLFHLTALLKPFLPNSVALAPYEIEVVGQIRLQATRQILQEYAQYCRSEVNLSIEETYLVLSDHLAHLTRFGIHPLQAEAIFLAYQEQLEACMLFTPSTVLRRLLYPSYGAFREHLLENSGIGLMCLKCSKPVNSATKKCEGCSRRPDPCPICWQKYSPFTLTKRARKMEEEKIPAIHIAPDGRLERLPLPETPSRGIGVKDDGTVVGNRPSPPVLWQFCLTCGHGGHAACLQRQQKLPDLDGRCPIAGCECACIPGPYRDLIVKQHDDAKIRSAMGSVRGDGRKVRESGAVKGARGLLGAQDERRVRVVEPEKT